MPSETLTKVLELLPFLTIKELEELRGRITMDLKEPLKRKTFAEMRDQGVPYLKELLLLFIRQNVVAPSKELLERNDKLQEINEKLNTTTKEVEQLVKQWDLNRIGTMKLCRLLVQLGSAQIDELERDVSFRYLVEKIKNPASLLDESFPGYANTQWFRDSFLK
jgi:hypothetical protein